MGSGGRVKVKRMALNEMVVLYSASPFKIGQAHITATASGEIIFSKVEPCVAVVDIGLGCGWKRHRRDGWNNGRQWCRG